MLRSDHVAIVTLLSLTRRLFHSHRFGESANLLHSLLPPIYMDT